MKQITKEELINFVLKNNIEFHPTQTKLCVPIINRLYRKMLIKIQFSGIKVVDNLIIDGHHRYLASLLAATEIDKVMSIRTSATKVNRWDLIDFVDEDWDTEAKIQMLNELDAKYNDLPLEQITDLLK